MNFDIFAALVKGEPIPASAWRQKAAPLTDLFTRAMMGKLDNNVSFVAGLKQAAQRQRKQEDEGDALAAWLVGE